jgi:uncharacterized protein YbaP (TraB family)
MITIMSRKMFLMPFALCVAVFSARAEPAMWVIKDADSTIYLIGTMHLLKHDTEWNADKVKKAVHESTDLWLEVENPDDQAAVMPLIAKLGMDPQHPLSSKLDAKQREKLAHVTGTYGIPAESVEPLRPWMAAVVLAVGPILKAGYDPKAGVERILTAQAREEGDKIHGLETPEEQLRFFAELPEPDQIAFLDGVLDDLDKGLDLLDKLAKAWIDGDTNTIAKDSLEEMKRDAPVAYDRLIVRRNISWTGKIQEILKGSGVQLIAVGAGHLAGPDSVQTQLEKRGIKVERY